MITQEYLKSILHYDPETGLFIWIVKRKRTKGKGSRADIPHHKGYTQIGIDKTTYMAHRLTWFYMTGKWPENEIDHINRIKNDNRWVNLREATRSQNLRNRKGTGKLNVKGVYKTKNNKYRAIIQLGTFDTIEEAEKIYNEAALKIAGEFIFKI